MGGILSRYTFDVHGWFVAYYHEAYLPVYAPPLSIIKGVFPCFMCNLTLS